MTITLTYFDFDASRGLECRLALTVAGVKFEDIRIDRPQWMEMKPTTPYGALPVFTDGDRRLAHSNAILGYVGRVYGLHPKDPWAGAEHDAVMQSVEDLRYKMPAGSDMTEEAKKTARETFAQGWLQQWASTLSDRIAGPFLEGKGLNVADLKIYAILRAFLSGGFDHIPASYFEAYPKLLGLSRAVEAHSAVAAYLASRK